MEESSNDPTRKKTTGTDDPPGLSSYCLLRSRPAAEWFDEARACKHGRRLLGDLWHEGEICVLVGDGDTGKSIFAVQIADAIARGESVGPYAIDTPPQKVLYFDLQLTTAEFAARYAPPPAAVPGGPRRKPAKTPTTHSPFARSLIRVALMPDDHEPEDFGCRSFSHYLGTAMYDQIDEHRANVIVIDDVSRLAGDRGSVRAGRLMRQLRRVRDDLGLSILVVANRRPRRRHAALAFADFAAAAPVAMHADSVFAVARSAFAPELRYLKHLRSVTGRSLPDDQDVAVFELTGGAPAIAAHAAATAALVPTVEPPRPAIISFDDLVRGHAGAQHSPPAALAARTPELSVPGFLHVGFSPERVHLIDPVRLAELAERRERQRLRRSKNVVEMLMSREYRRYLES